MGVTLWEEDGRIRYDAPRSVLTPEVLDRVRAHRTAILQRIRTGPDRPAATGRPGRLRLRPLTPPGADPVLIVIPGAGVGPRAFGSWERQAPGGVEVVAVHLPGREELLGEVPYTRVEPLADRLADEITSGYADRRCVLVGHSGGALIAAEVARRLPADRLALLVAAAAVPPDLIDPDILTASDEDLVAGMREHGGIPAEWATDPGALAAFLPAVRADLAVAVSCRREWTEADRLEVPLLALHGRADESVTGVHCDRWRRWTRAAVRVRELDGDHFFPARAGGAVMAEVRDFLGHGH